MGPKIESAFAKVPSNCCCHRRRTCSMGGWSSALVAHKSNILVYVDCRTSRGLKGRHPRAPHETRAKFTFSLHSLTVCCCCAEFAERIHVPHAFKILFCSPSCIYTYDTEAPESVYSRPGFDGSRSTSSLSGDFPATLKKWLYNTSDNFDAKLKLPQDDSCFEFRLLYGVSRVGWACAMSVFDELRASFRRRVTPHALIRHVITALSFLRTSAEPQSLNQSLKQV